MLRNRTVLELCDPEPFTVATWILMSFTTRFCPSWPDDPRGTTSVVAITPPFWSGPNLMSAGQTPSPGARLERSENLSVYPLLYAPKSGGGYQSINSKKPERWPFFRWCECGVRAGAQVGFAWRHPFGRAGRPALQAFNVW